MAGGLGFLLFAKLLQQALHSFNLYFAIAALRACPKAPFILPLAALWVRGALCALCAGAPACPTSELIFPGGPHGFEPRCL